MESKAGTGRQAQADRKFGTLRSSMLCGAHSFSPSLACEKVAKHQLPRRNEDPVTDPSVVVTDGRQHEQRQRPGDTHIKRSSIIDPRSKRWVSVKKPGSVTPTRVSQTCDQGNLKGCGELTPHLHRTQFYRRVAFDASTARTAVHTRTHHLPMHNRLRMSICDCRSRPHKKPLRCTNI